MLIAHVFFTVTPADRQKALDVLTSEAAGLRATPECLAFVPFLDPSDEGGIGLLHEWTSDAAFAAYTASDGFAAVGQSLRPMMTGAPVSRRFDARLIEVIN